MFSSTFAQQARFVGQVLTLGQELTFEYQGTNYLLRVNNIMVSGKGGSGKRCWCYLGLRFQFPSGVAVVCWCKD